MKTTMLLLSVALAALLSCSHAHKSFQSRIPNGDRVPNPCQPGAIWAGVGHQSPAGANARNPFGMDFKAAGLQWTVDLCRKDSDGDGLTKRPRARRPTACGRSVRLQRERLDCPTLASARSTPRRARTRDRVSEGLQLSSTGRCHVTMRNLTLKPTPVPANE
ncbi:hypothetical protein BOX15_Mlig017064g1, partial [Macrostomum lignano]